MKIIVDSREQAPFPFTGPLYTGVAVERKRLPDLVPCRGRERERFERELACGAALDAFCVVVESSWQDLVTGLYRSRRGAGMRAAPVVVMVAAVVAAGCDLKKAHSPCRKAPGGSAQAMPSAGGGMGDIFFGWWVFLGIRDFFRTY